MNDGYPFFSINNYFSSIHICRNRPVPGPYSIDIGYIKQLGRGEEGRGKDKNSISLCFTGQPNIKNTDCRTKLLLLLFGGKAEGKTFFINFMLQKMLINIGFFHSIYYNIFDINASLFVQKQDKKGLQLRTI